MRSGDGAGGGADTPEVRAYCDGACRGNPGVGAWAAIVVRGGDEQELSSAVERTTNNRMELLAAIAALESLPDGARVRLVTDSQYVHRGMTEWIDGWRRRGWVTAGKSTVLNRDLWERLSGEAERHRVEWVWVRGHAGHEYNERCDRLANRTIDEFLQRA